jgi:hypothetical protein
MSITFELPRDLELEVRGKGLDLNSEAKVAFLIDLYRRDQITHRQLGEALGLSRYETDGILKRHGVSPNVSLEEMEAQASALRDARPK